MNCLICGEILKGYADQKIYKCSHCGFGQTLQLKAQVGSYHRDEIYIEEETLFRNIFQKRINIISKFSKSGRALEIGCSTGIMLSLLQEKGWSVTGVEMSKKAAEIAKKRGINIITKPFEEISVKENFDLVILNHTLEHLKDPVSVLKKISKLLMPGGLLFVDVPNFGGLSAKLQGKNWPLLLPREHRWHFSYKALEILLEKIGFKIIFVDQSSGIWNVDNPLLESFNSLVRFKKRFFEEVLSAIPSLIVSKLKMGSDLMVISRKI